MRKYKVALCKGQHTAADVPAIPVIYVSEGFSSFVSNMRIVSEVVEIELEDKEAKQKEQ